MTAQQPGAMVHEDARRILTLESGVLKAQGKASGKVNTAYLGNGATTTDRLPPGTDRAIRAQGEDPQGWYAVVADGHPRMVLPPETRAAVEGAIRKANGPAPRERREIGRLFARAEGLRDDPGAFFPAQRRAEEALAAWRAKYPEEAVEEDRADLRRLADDLRRKALGALVHDMDGSLSREDQQRRHDEFMRQADEADRKAARLGN